MFIRAGGSKVCINAVNAGGERWAEYSEAASRRAATGGRRMLPVLDRGDADGRFWIAYEVGSARSLADHRPLPTSTSRRVLSDVARALDEAAAKGVFAWELPPESVFVTEKGARLGDLGTAREALAGAKLELGGDQAYVPPEVLRGKGADERSGVYLFGALLHYLLTGAAPKRGSGSPGEYRQPNLPASINAIVATTTADDPANRPRSVSEAHDMAARALRGAPPARGRRRRVAGAGRVKDAKTSAASATATAVTATATAATATAATARRAFRKATIAKRASPAARPGKHPSPQPTTTRFTLRKPTPKKRPLRDATTGTSRSASTAKRSFRDPTTAQRALRKAANAKRAFRKAANAKRAFRRAATAKRLVPKVDPARPLRRLAALPRTWGRGLGLSGVAAVPGRRLLGAGAIPVTRQRVVGVAGALVLGASAGLLLGSSPDPEPARAQTVSAGGLSVTLPPGPHRVEPRDEGLAVRAPGSLLRARITGSSLPPSQDARPVQLGTLQAWRHSAGGEVRYSVPTSRGTLAVTCHATSRSSRPLRLCERTASTLRLRDARVLSLAAVAEESRRLRTAIATLAANLDAARARLGDASTPEGQRVAAQELAHTHERAATALRGLTGAGPVEAAARDAADAYSRLAAAAEGRSAGRWAEASEEVRRSDAVLAEAIAAAS